MRVLYNILYVCAINESFFKKNEQNEKLATVESTGGS